MVGLPLPAENRNLGLHPLPAVELLVRPYIVVALPGMVSFATLLA